MSRALVDELAALIADAIGAGIDDRPPAAARAVLEHLADVAELEVDAYVDGRAREAIAGFAEQLRAAALPEPVTVPATWLEAAAGDRHLQVAR